MPFSLKERRTWSLQIDKMLYNIFAEYDEHPVITGTLAKVVCSVNDRIIFEDKTRWRASSVLSQTFPILIPHAGFNILLNVIVKSAQTTQITESADFELAVNGKLLLSGGTYTFDAAGGDLVSDTRDKAIVPDRIDANNLKVRLQELADLHSQGVIDADEYKTLRTKIIRG